VNKFKNGAESELYWDISGSGISDNLPGMAKVGG
jgi:hypothetical protein